MAGVVFFFEEQDVDVFSGRQLALSAWNYAIKAAGDIDKVIVVNRTTQKIGSFDSSLSFTVVDELPVLAGRLAYIVCPWDNVKTKTPLWDFDHEVDWYIFGPAAGWRKYPPLLEGITVPMAGKGALHAVHIASTVMLHRFGVRSWQPQ